MKRLTMKRSFKSWSRGWLAILGILSLGRAMALDIGFDPPLGHTLPTSIQLIDEHGHRRSLTTWITRPTVLVPVYYRCGNLCDTTLTGLAAALQNTRLTSGNDYDVVAFSFAPEEQASDTQTMRKMLTTMHPDRVAAWQLLRGDRDNIQALTQALGFRYFYDRKQHQYAHAAGLVVVDSSGRVTHFFQGVSFDSGKLSQALQAAARGTVGAMPPRLLLSCYHYDPVTGRYSLNIMRIVSLLAAITVIVLGSVIAMHLYTDRRRRIDMDAPHE